MFIRHHQAKKAHERGQILLITVMLLAAAVTVVMTIAFNSTTETQITKLEEDSQKALSAAETALEAAIQRKLKTNETMVLSDIGSFSGSGITGEAKVVLMAGNEFVTPLLQRDEQYTFYLSVLDDTVSPPAFSSYWTGNLVVYLQSESVANCADPSKAPALEMTFIDSANVISRALIDPCSIIQGNGVPANRLTTLAGGTIKETAFAYKTPATGTILQGLSNKKLAVVRVLNAPTRIGFTGTDLRPQGRVITSEAKTQTGVTKKIELFQSFPQIPSDFFVTSF